MRNARLYDVMDDWSRHKHEARRRSVLGHGHVFEVWILISSGSDIIIQIRTRGFGVI